MASLAHNGITVKIKDWLLTATKINPGQSTFPGFYRLLLPQLVGSFVSGGGVSGDGCRPGGAYLINSFSETSSHNAASGMTPEGFHSSASP